MENNKMVGDSGHGNAKDKSPLTNLVAFCDRATAVADKGRVTDKASSDKALSNLVQWEISLPMSGGLKL